MCEMNKNHLLDFFFNEVTERERKKFQNHIRQCPECLDYLDTLGITHNQLQQLPPEKPRADSLEFIMKSIAKPAEKKAEIKPIFHLTRSLWIPLTAIAVLIVMLMIKEKLIQLPLWRSLESIWIVQQIGAFGTTLLLFAMTGILITLLVTPILIFESQNKQYRFNI